MNMSFLALPWACVALEPLANLEAKRCLRGDVPSFSCLVQTGDRLNSRAFSRRPGRKVWVGCRSDPTELLKKEGDSYEGSDELGVE